MFIGHKGFQMTFASIGFVLLFVSVGFGAGLVVYLFKKVKQNILHSTIEDYKLDSTLLQLRSTLLRVQEDYNSREALYQKVQREIYRLKAIANREDLVRQYMQDEEALAHHINELQKIMASLHYEIIHYELNALFEPIQNMTMHSTLKPGRDFFDKAQLQKQFEALPKHKKSLVQLHKRLCQYRIPQQIQAHNSHWGEYYSRLVNQRDHLQQEVSELIQLVELQFDRLTFVQDRIDRIDMIEDWGELSEAIEQQLIRLQPTDIELEHNLSLDSIQQQLDDIEGTLDVHQRLSQFLDAAQSKTVDR